MQAKYFIKGEKIYLRPYDFKEDGLVFKWFNDPLVTYYLFTGQKPKTVEQIHQQMEADISSENDVIFTIVDIKSNEPIGIVGLWDIHQSARKAELRIFIGEKDFWGKGRGTEATEMVVFYGFDRLNLNRIRLGFTSEHKKAQKAYEKAGFKLEGVFKQDIYRNSKYYDSTLMAILREDYYKKIYPKHKKRFALDL